MTHVLLWLIGTVGYIEDPNGADIPILRTNGGILVLVSTESLIGQDAPGTSITGEDAEALVTKFREETKCL